MFRIYLNGNDVPYEPFTPTFPQRVEVLARSVLAEMREMDWCDPNTTPLSEMYDMVDSAVFCHFPELSQNVRLMDNRRYVRLLTKKVGMRAFELLDAENAG